MIITLKKQLSKYEEGQKSLDQSSEMLNESQLSNFNINQTEDQAD